MLDWSWSNRFGAILINCVLPSGVPHSVWLRMGTQITRCEAIRFCAILLQPQQCKRGSVFCFLHDSKSMQNLLKWLRGVNGVPHFVWLRLYTKSQDVSYFCILFNGRKRRYAFFPSACFWMDSETIEMVKCMAQWMNLKSFAINGGPNLWRKMDARNHAMWSIFAYPSPW